MSGKGEIKGENKRNGSSFEEYKQFFDDDMFYSLLKNEQKEPGSFDRFVQDQRDAKTRALETGVNNMAYYDLDHKRWSIQLMLVEN